MLNTSLPNKFHLKSPPRLKSNAANSETNDGQALDLSDAYTSDKSSPLHQLVGGALLLGSMMIPQTAQAAEVVVEQPTLALENVDLQADLSEEILTLDPAAVESASAANLPTEDGDGLSDKLKRTGDKIEKAVDNFVPDAFTDRQEHKIGDWNLSFQPTDLSLRPRWDHGPQLKLRGDFLETSLYKNQELGHGWSTQKGIRGNIRGEISTSGKHELDVYIQAYQGWEGPIHEDFHGKFDVGVGLRDRLYGEETQPGLSAGLTLRQRIEGGGFQFRGHDYIWSLDARQEAYHNLESGNTDFSYKVHVGPKRDFDISVFGHKGRIEATVGPEFRGSTAEGRDAFDVGLKARIRTRF